MVNISNSWNQKLYFITEIQAFLVQQNNLMQNLLCYLVSGLILIFSNLILKILIIFNSKNSENNINSFQSD